MFIPFRLAASLLGFTLLLLSEVVEEKIPRSYRRFLSRIHLSISCRYTLDRRGASGPLTLLGEGTPINVVIDPPLGRTVWVFSPFLIRRISLGS